MRYLLFALLLLGAHLGCRAQPASLVPDGKALPAGTRPVPDGLPAGTVAPAFRLMDTSGKAVALQDFRGKVVYLDFWGSWCRPCLAEMPAGNKLRAGFRGRDVVFVYIAQETVVDNWKTTIAQHGLADASSVHLLDPEGKYACRAYGIQGFPTYMLIGRDGRVLNGNAPRPSDGRRTVQAIEAALAAR